MFNQQKDAIFPYYPVKAIVVRNVELNSPLLKSKCEEAKQKAIDVNQQVLYGPFSVEVNSSNQDSNQSSSESTVETAIKIT